MARNIEAWSRFIEAIETNEDVIKPGAVWREVTWATDDEGDPLPTPGWVSVDGYVHLPSLIAAAVEAGLTSEQ